MGNLALNEDMAIWLTDQEQADLAYYQHRMYQAKLNGDAPTLINIAQQASAYLANVNANIHQRQQKQAAATLLGNIVKGIINFVGGMVEGIGKLFNRGEKDTPTPTLSGKREAIAASDITIPIGGFSGFSKFGKISHVYRPVQQEGDGESTPTPAPTLPPLPTETPTLLPLSPEPTPSFWGGILQYMNGLINQWINTQEAQESEPSNSSTYLYWGKPVYSQFPIDISDGDSPAFQDLFGNGADGNGARGIRLFAVGSNAYESTSGLHPGMDFYVPIGTPVLSISNGIVVGVTQNGTPSVPFVERLAPEDVNMGLNTVIARYGYTYVIYAHLGSVNVTVGEHLEAGAIVGAVGNYPVPDSFGPHLHLEVRTVTQGTTYEDFTTRLGFEAQTGIITEEAKVNPFIFVNPYNYFTEYNQGLLNEAAVAAANSPRYPTEFESPNGGYTDSNGQPITPETQNTRCFDIVGTPFNEFSICDHGLIGAPTEQG